VLCGRGEQNDVNDAEEMARIDDEDKLTRGQLVAGLQGERERHGHEKQNAHRVVPKTRPDN
jgi:hypothetical protein